MEVLFLCIGLGLLILGGELALRGAVGLSRMMGVSPAIIGLTVMGFGTSAPELVVTVRAALAGSFDIAVGNAVGSNIANTFLILGVGALICPLACDPKAVFRDTGFMVAVSILLCVLGYIGVIGRWEGAAMVLALLIFVCWTYFHDIRTHDAAAELHSKMVGEMPRSPSGLPIIGGYLIAGIAGLVYGASLLVDSAVTLAEAAGVPQSIIGLTLVAFGTSLPELGATAVAAWRRHTDIAIANVVGSNIFNILGVLGTGAIFQPLIIAPEIANIDQWIVLVSAIILVPIIITGWRINRMEGVVLLLLYAGYIGSVTLRL
ncbi:MAG: calcium/sodium antiporter [Alphaproteobacteria bacterium]